MSRLITVTLSPLHYWLFEYSESVSSIAYGPACLISRVKMGAQQKKMCFGQIHAGCGTFSKISVPTCIFLSQKGKNRKYGQWITSACEIFNVPIVRFERPFCIFLTWKTIFMTEQIAENVIFNICLPCCHVWKWKLVLLRRTTCAVEAPRWASWKAMRVAISAIVNFSLSDDSKKHGFSPGLYRHTFS